MKKQALLNVPKILLCTVGLSGLLNLTIQSSSFSVSVGSKPSRSLVQAIKREKGSNLAKLFSEIKYWFIEEDLNSDGIKEAIVYTRGPDCGAWLCPVYIFQKNGAGYRLVDEVKVFIGGGISILPSRSNGWSDIAFRIARVGTIPLKVEWRKGFFNGNEYQLGEALKSQPDGYILQYQQGSGISLANSDLLDPQKNSVSRFPSDVTSQPIYKEQAYKGKAQGARVIQDLPSGNYTFCKRNSKTPCLTRFEFRKINNRVVGNYISADDEICIDGIVDGNTILGQGLDGPGSVPYKQPQKSNSSLQGNDSREWIRDDNSLKVSKQSTFNLPLKNYGGTENTRYSAWFKYASIQLDLQGFQQKVGKSFNPPQRCQIIHPLTGKVVETSESKISANRSPSTAQQYKEQGDSKSRNGDKRGAISDYTSAIRLNSSFAVAYYNRAIDRVSVGDWQGALVDFRKAAELFKQQGKGRDQRDALSEIAKLQGGEKTASANCPTGQIPVVIKTADGQSPSYAGAANAGRTKNGKRTDGSKITPDARCISLVNIQSPSNPEETWLISHGWDDSSEGSLKNLAQEIAKRKPQDRVLILDWSEASNNKGDDGASPIGLSEKLSRGNYYAATWIRPVAEVVVQELKQKYNLDPASAANSLNLIGHSLGSLVSSEVGRIYKQNNGVGTSYLIALDPPSEFNVSTGSPIQDLGGYDLDGRTPAYKAVRKPSTTALAIKLTSPFETRTLVPGNVDRPQRFDSIARFSRAFVGKMSIAGNQAFAATAHESFQMDFGDRSDPRELLPTLSSLGREHGLVVESFTKRIAGEGLAPGFLGLNDRKQHSDIKRDAYPYNRKPFDPNSGDYQYAHEGVINISSSNEFSSFHLESPSVGKVVFSTPQNVENDTVYIQLDATTKGKRGRVAGGDLLPNVYQLFPSIAPINYMPLVR